MPSSNECGKDCVRLVTPEQAFRDREHLDLLLGIEDALVSHLGFSQQFRALSEVLTRVFHNDYTGVCLYEPSAGVMQVQAFMLREGHGFIHEQLIFELSGTPAGETFETRKPLIVNELSETRYPSQITRRLLAEGITTGCWVPIMRCDRRLGVLSIGNRKGTPVRQDAPELLSKVANLLAVAMENGVVIQKTERPSNSTAGSASSGTLVANRMLQSSECPEIVGVSPEWRGLLEQIEAVAPTDATVLVLGETGTGKEIVARAIHNMSPRRDQKFVSVNCSAVPGGLLESELFGHERGAFTGATKQQIGRFELAHKGTILFDEIGDTPIELQPKLLRVLQERKFERLGSTRTISVDARVIAATNRDLRTMVADRMFRDDLFYRVNVFPLFVPPLRDRRDDIPVLVHHFAQFYARQMNRPIENIPDEIMERLIKYHWPGNVRELQNVVERGVILSRDGTLQISMRELHPAQSRQSSQLSEREQILEALRACRGVIGGPTGAAAWLGIKRTTLNSRMQKLGLSRNDIWAVISGSSEKEQEFPVRED